MTSPNVIVFGPTGGVGSVAARTAHDAGARVTLAMRDPSKPVADLPETLPRVRADLSDPASVREAAAAAGPRAAFLYLVFGQPDRMRAAVEALRAGGVEYVVFLSSAALHTGDDVRAVAPGEFIAWQHAGVEAALIDVFGPEGYVALRPGFFTTNLLQYKGALAHAAATGDGVIRVPAAEAFLDFILPEDIGRVAGRLLVTRDVHGPVPLCGAELRTLREALELVGRALGRSVAVENFASDDEAVGYMIQTFGHPEPLAHYLVRSLKKRAQDGLSPEVTADYEEAKGNILKYGGKETGRLEEWVEANHAKFLE